MRSQALCGALLLLSCSTELVIEPEELPEAGADAHMEVAAPPPHVTPTAEEIEARIAARMAQIADEQRAEVNALPSVHRSAASEPTAIQRALNGYNECFSELWTERRRCRARFSRVWPEATLIRRMGNDEGLLAATQTVLGRIILSEANWLHDERRDRFFPDQNHAEIDAPGIYQVLRHTRRTGETLLGAMRRHAPHVSEARPSIPGRRMEWIVNLQLTCARPRGFPETDRQGNPIDWDDDGYRERCENLFVYAGRLLSGEQTLGVWDGAPVVTWGGRCDDEQGACDDHLASHRGLVPWEPPSGPTPANRFWCNPRSSGCDGPPLDIGDAATDAP